MIALALLLGASPLDVCYKPHGVEPTPCELALLDVFVNEALNRQNCQVKLEYSNILNKELELALYSKPPPPKKHPLSLFGMPPWVTPVLVGVLFSAGVGVGLAF